MFCYDWLLNHWLLYILNGEKANDFITKSLFLNLQTQSVYSNNYMVLSININRSETIRTLYFIVLCIFGVWENTSKPYESLVKLTIFFVEIYLTKKKEQ